MGRKKRGEEGEKKVSPLCILLSTPEKRGKKKRIAESKRGGREKKRNTRAPHR